MRFAGALIVAFVTGLACCALASWVHSGRAERAPLLNRSGLLALRRGMTTGEVVSLIGYPLEIRGVGPRNATPLGLRGDWPSEYAWIYATAGIMESGLEVAVVVQGSTVTTVHVEHGDRTVYDSESKPGNNAEILRLLD